MPPKKSSTLGAAL
jgi:DNA repair exonuclease SbcCD ATPase subunit